ncbi:hypothetical protein PWP93_35710 [Paraburkholderia sp. A1RI-2L]|uniref:hypothetical protein n=1 Tax=Paraburkholderia sp. A1RI-2L TaxID=3028367 RepID=UPI003B7AA79E
MKSKERNTQKRGKSVLGVLEPARGLMTCALAAVSVGTAHAREPSRADQAFCDHYAAVMQEALEVDRSGDPAAIARFRQSVIRDPQAQLLMPGLGVNLTTPPWVADVTMQSRKHCLDEVRLNMRGFLPGDPERPKPESTPDAHIGTIARLPSERETAASGKR